MSSSFTGNPNNFLPQSHIFPEDNPQEYDVKLRTYLNDISSAVNTKDSGLYTDEEVITGQQFVPTFSTTESSSLNYRDVFRKVIDFGALPNATGKSVAHGIDTTENFTVVRIYGAATNPGASTLTQAIPIPYVDVSTPANGVQLTMGPTVVALDTNANLSMFTRCFIIVEYIKIV